MGNPFDMRRYADIFSGGRQQEDPLMRAIRGVNFGAQQPMPQPITPQAPEVDPITSALERLRGGKASEAYRKHVSDLPNPQDYAPSKWRRLGAAAIAGAASFGKDPQNAMALGEGVRDAPLRGAMQNWQLKGAGLKEQADIEQQDVKGQIEYIKQIRDQQEKAQRLALDISKADTDRYTAESLAQYRQAQIANMESQGWTQSIRPDGTLWMVKPGQEPQYMGPSMEGRKMADTERRTGLEAGRLADAQRRTGIMGQNAATYANQPRAGAFVSPADQFTSDAIAVQEVLRQNPQYAGWVNEAGQIKQPSEYSRWGSGAPNPATNPDFRTFLQLVEAAKNRTMGTRRPGPGAVLTPGGQPPPPMIDFDQD